MFFKKRHQKELSLFFLEVFNLIYNLEIQVTEDLKMFWLKCRKVFLNLEQQRSLPLNETPFMFTTATLPRRENFRKTNAEIDAQERSVHLLVAIVRLDPRLRESMS